MSTLLIKNATILPVAEPAERRALALKNTSTLPWSEDTEPCRPSGDRGAYADSNRAADAAGMLKGNKLLAGPRGRRSDLTFDWMQEPDALVVHVRICAGGLYW